VTGNLIELDDRPDRQSHPNELNQRIGQIDADLDQLRSTLTSTNQDLLEKLSLLNDTREMAQAIEALQITSEVHTTQIAELKQLTQDKDTEQQNKIAAINRNSISWRSDTAAT
jgi:ABC-type transporter Mla subunit MlaD